MAIGSMRVIRWVGKLTRCQVLKFSVANGAQLEQPASAMGKGGVDEKLRTAILTWKVADDLNLCGNHLAAQKARVRFGSKAIRVRIEYAPRVRFVWLSRHLTSTPTGAHPAERPNGGASVRVRVGRAVRRQAPQ